MSMLPATPPSRSATARAAGKTMVSTWATAASCTRARAPATPPTRSRPLLGHLDPEFIALLIGLPTFAMGATIPVFARIAQSHGVPLSHLYGINTLGTRHVIAACRAAEPGKAERSASPDDAVCGGLTGCVYWGGFEIELLWVTPARRGLGIGGRVLAQAEAAARDLGAGIAFLRTVRARRFYEGHGYRVFGELEDRPPGSVLLFMKKRLDR